MARRTTLALILLCLSSTTKAGFFGGGSGGGIGPTGPTGNPGATGPTGAPGATGPQRLVAVWDAGTPYLLNDLALDRGGFWQATGTNTNSEPVSGNTDWTLAGG